VFYRALFLSKNIRRLVTEPDNKNLKENNMAPPNNTGKGPAGFNRRLFAYPLFYTGANILAASGGVITQNVAGFGAGQQQIFTHFSFVADGPFLIQITPTDLNAGLFNAAVPSGTLLALLDRPGQLPYPITVVETNQLTVQLTNDNGAVANNVRFVFWGYREFMVNCG
jgi:hypothetical protein